MNAIPTLSTAKTTTTHHIFISEHRPTWFGVVGMEWNRSSAFPPFVLDSRFEPIGNESTHIYYSSCDGWMDGWMVRWDLRREVAVVARLHS